MPEIHNRWYLMPRDGRVISACRSEVFIRSKKRLHKHSSGAAGARSVLSPLISAAGKRTYWKCVCVPAALVSSCLWTLLANTVICPQTPAAVMRVFIEHIQSWEQSYCCTLMNVKSRASPLSTKHTDFCCLCLKHFMMITSTSADSDMMKPLTWVCVCAATLPCDQMQHFHLLDQKTAANPSDTSIDQNITEKNTWKNT